MFSLSSLLKILWKLKLYLNNFNFYYEPIVFIINAFKSKVIEVYEHHVVTSICYGQIRVIIELALYESL
jgi:hypothetical protein